MHKAFSGALNNQTHENRVKTYISFMHKALQQRKRHVASLFFPQLKAATFGCTKGSQIVRDTLDLRHAAILGMVDLLQFGQVCGARLDDAADGTLYAAAANGRVEAVRFILENAEYAEPMNALLGAATSGSLDVAKVAITARPDVINEILQSQTEALKLFTYAAYCECSDIRKRLQSQRSEILKILVFNIRERPGHQDVLNFWLPIAVDYGLYEVVETLFFLRSDWLNTRAVALRLR